MDSRIQAAIDAARLSPAREICGVLTDDQFIQLENIAESGDEFQMDAAEYSAVYAANTVTAIVHSHPGDVTPSIMDGASCTQTQLPWLIVNGVGHYVWTYPAVERAPLYGRLFTPGLFDCVTFCRDYYHWALGIEVPLPDYTVDLWRQGIDQINPALAAAGFEKRLNVDNLAIHDVCVFTLEGSKVPNHLAIYLGNNLLGEQRRGEPSRVYLLTDALRARMSFVLRHFDAH